jgi:hypothetical protein
MGEHFKIDSLRRVLILRSFKHSLVTVLLANVLCSCAQTPRADCWRLRARA